MGECIVLFISNYYFWYGICPSKTINFFQEIIILKKFNRTLAQASHTILFCLRPLRPSETIFSSLGYYCPISARVAALDKFRYKIKRSVNFESKLSCSHLNQKPNKIFLPWGSILRAEIFRSVFGSNEKKSICFRNLLTFSTYRGAMSESIEIEQKL